MSDMSITRGEIPADAPPPARSRNWGRTLRRVFGWGAVGLFFFLLFAWIALPTRAIAWRIGYEAKKAGYVVDIEDISVMPWGSATLENVTWTFEPSRPDAPPQQYFMEEVGLSISLLSLLGGSVDVEVETEREDGTIWARYAQGSKGTTVEVNVDGLPLYDVPKAAQALNVPLYGLLNVKVDVTAPEGKFSKAEGNISIACSGCRAGDGESKLYIPGGSKALRDGITLPEIDFGTLTGELVVKDGAATIEEPIATESEDMIMSLTGKLKLKDPFAKSRFNMLLKLELTESFLQEAERLAFIYRGASEKAKLDPPERGLGFRLGGPVSRPRFRGVKTKSTAETLAERRKKRRDKDRRRAARRAKRSKNKPKKKADTEATDTRKKGDEEPNLNIRPIDDGPAGRDAEPGRGDESREDSAAGRDQEDDGRPALPPPEDDSVEVFDPEGESNAEPSDDERYGRNDGDAEPADDQPVEEEANVDGEGDDRGAGDEDGQGDGVDNDDGSQ